MQLPSNQYNCFPPKLSKGMYGCYTKLLRTAFNVYLSKITIRSEKKDYALQVTALEVQNAHQDYNST